MPEQANRSVRFLLIAKEASRQDAAWSGGENKLGRNDNNGRKICATELMPQLGETDACSPLWHPPAVLPTGEGGFEISTATEFSAQDRHKHEKGTEIYSVLEGEMEIYVDDEGPYVLRAGDEIVILPGTVHEIVRKKHGSRREGEEFQSLFRVHSLRCEGARDKYVQLAPGGEWRRWSELSPEERNRSYRKQG